MPTSIDKALLTCQYPIIQEPCLKKLHQWQILLCEGPKQRIKDPMGLPVAPLPRTTVDLKNATVVDVIHSIN